MLIRISDSAFYYDTTTITSMKDGTAERNKFYKYVVVKWNVHAVNHAQQSRMIHTLNQ